MKGLLGVKLGMTQVFDEGGVVTPVTVIQAGPCYVTQIKTTETDGYSAVQVGFGETKEQRLTGGQKGHLGLLKSNKKRSRSKQGNGMPPLRHLREFRTKQAGSYEVGQELTVEQFAEGDRVDARSRELPWFVAPEKAVVEGARGGHEPSGATWSGCPSQ